MFHLLLISFFLILIFILFLFLILILFLFVFLFIIFFFILFFFSPFRDPGLSAIGKQIKYLESECKKEEELKIREWTKTTKPLLEQEIKDLDKSCSLLKDRIDSELRLGKK